MVIDNKCIFCKNICKSDYEGKCRYFTINCDICGDYKITNRAKHLLEMEASKCYPKVSAVLKHKTLLEEPLLLINSQKNENENENVVTIEDLEKEYPVDDIQRIERVLVNLRKLSKIKGASIKVEESSYPVFFTDSNRVETLSYVLEELSGEGYITRDTGIIPDSIKLTPKGWSNTHKEKENSYNIKERVLLAIYEEEQNDVPDLMGKITYSALGIERNKFYIALEKLINEGFLNSNKVKLIPGDNTTQGVIFGTTVMTREGNEYARKLLKLGSKGTNNQETEVNTKGIEIDTKSFDFWQLIHPEICSVSKNKFEDGYYADAVETALKHINKRVKDIVKHKTGKELDGAPLMQYAFSLDNPIIKLNNLTNDTEKNIQKGYLQIFAGTMTGIRNPKAHDNLSITKENAIHLIFLVSLLMYKLDKVF